MDEIENLRKAIAALEGQRDLLGDAVVDTALKPLREKLVALTEQASPVEPQLKDITILFTDIVGSTQFSQNLDPEDIQSILNGALRMFNEVIQRYDGRVVRFMGDGLKAVFGAPVSSEGDAERAVRAGLELLRVAGDYSQSLRAEWGIEQFSIRVGINTGQVLVGGGMEADNNAMGMAVNLGARLESLASPGCVLISHDTYRHVRGLFDVQEQALARVKGSDEPVRTYIVLQARERSFRNPTRGLVDLETPLVGRKAELRQLQESLRTLSAVGKTSMISVIGEAGVGKSRLLQEFEGSIAAGEMPVNIYKGRSLEHTVNQPYSLLHSLLAYSFNVLESDALLDMRHKVELAIRDYLLDDEAIMKAHFIGMLAGFDFSDSPHLMGVHNDPRQLRDRALFYLAQYFNAVAQSAPMVIILDDLHWADSPSLDAVIALSRECRGALFICLARQSLLEKRPDWGTESEGAEHAFIWLQPLSAQESGQLVGEILSGGNPVAGSLSKIVQENAEGNPYYLEEIIKNLIEESILVAGVRDDGWHIDTSRLRELNLPPTLNALLQARLDRLNPGEKLIIQQASVVGRIFWDALLRKMRSEPLSGGAVQPELPELVSVQRRDLVVEQGASTFADTREYSFKHSLLRDAAYRTVLKQNRRSYHRQVAEWLLSLSQMSDRIDEYTAVIAEHFDKAGEVSTAADFYIRAGDLARAQYSGAEALAFYERALTLIPKDNSDKQWQALLGKSEVLGLLGEIETRLEVDQELVALAQALGDERFLGMAYYRQGYAFGVIGDHDGKMLAYDRALEHAGKAGDLDTETLVLGLKALMLSRLGQSDDAMALAQKALIYARQSTDKEVLARTLVNIGTCFSECGDIGQSARLWEEGVQVCERLGNKQGAAITLGNLGYNYTLLGLFELGRNTLLQSVEQAQLIGDSLQRMAAQLNAALNLILVKDADGALTQIQQVALEASRVKDAFSQAVCHTYRGLAREQKGEFFAACAHFEEAYQALNGLGYLPYAMDALAGVARCELHQGRLEDARTHAEQIWKHLDQNGSPGMETPIQAYLTCARVFAAAGESAAARRALEKGAADLQERAMKISDLEWRTAYLENFPEHGEIIAMRDSQAG